MDFDIDLIVRILYSWLPVSILMALVEIEIEGPHPWMTGQKNTIQVNSKILRFVFGKKKNFTRYHIFMFLLILLFSMHPTIQEIGKVAWSEVLRIFFRDLGCYIFFITFLEDFLYFVFNENWGIFKFKKENMPWDESWAFNGYVPTGYLFCILISGIILSITIGLLNFLFLFGLTAVGTTSCIVISHDYHQSRREGLKRNVEK